MVIAALRYDVSLFLERMPFDSFLQIHSWNQGARRTEKVWVRKGTGELTGKRCLNAISIHSLWRPTPSPLSYLRLNPYIHKSLYLLHALCAQHVLSFLTNSFRSGVSRTVKSLAWRCSGHKTALCQVSSLCPVYFSLTCHTVSPGPQHWLSRLTNRYRSVFVDQWCCVLTGGKSKVCVHGVPVSLLLSRASCPKARPRPPIRQKSVDQ